MAQWSANINVMIKAARRAGRMLMRDFGEVDKLQVSTKGTGEFVNRADIRAEEFLREDLEEARANYGWTSERAGEVAGADPTRRWIVAPLEGAENFVHGLPHWALSIALEYKGEIVAGLVFNPIDEELFVAEKGNGSWLNDQRIRVSGRRDLDRLIVGTTLPSGSKSGLPTALKDIAHIAPAVTGVRNWGCSSLNLAYVAAGRYDACWDRKLDIWNIAAGALIVKEAGGLSQGIKLNSDPLETGSIIAANNEVFDRFAKTLRSA
ncbi:inositol monophosphatase [Amylibacter ulvae]|uniref:Inositol-1-monophosphatase n=1 Tax=Paramylibacter ulvae TaxID=1651968 RepID=A0ABQ3D864_9RHOB|nr:inositol monophosphatase family protein [Amylibacter ulvae]GHA60453.1 inositol monophosphatase [Amylibacter ulvae]